MKKLVFCIGLLFVAFAAQLAVQAQGTTGSLSGTVVDATGAVVPGATVTIKGESGQEFTNTTNSDGRYQVPGVGAGFYTVTVTAPNFKTSVTQNVKVDVATPATVDATLTAGQIDEQVIVTSGAEVLQTQTATIGTNIQGRQILETPIQSRDALDLVTLLPGTSTTGVVRTSSINGLPKSALTIQIDGVDVQDNFLKSSDGFFTFIRPRIDAIDEVTVSTSNPGAESSGDGAVGIRFVTKRGTDNYRGSAFYQHRDEGLNATNFQNNYLNVPKSKLRLNQFGGSFGGPLPFFNFGENDGPLFKSGKGESYFFVNYERFHLNESSPNRTRTVLTPEAQNGVFRYGPGGANSINLFTLAAAQPGLPTTVDPTVASVLSTIRSATAIRGTFAPVGRDGTFFRQGFNFSNDGTQRRRFLAVRMDFNLTKNHALEGIFNDQPFRSNVDFLNGVDPTFPGIQNAGTQLSDRRSLSLGLRSSFGGNVVNQFRYAQLAGWLGGNSRFELVGGPEFFTNTQRGVSLTLGSGLTGLTIRNGDSLRSSPTRDISNNLTWVTGDHSFTFGGQLKKIETISDSRGLIVPGVTFGVVAGDPFLTGITAATIQAASGATIAPSAVEVANAQNLYATLAGRVSAFNSNAVLGADGQYAVNGPRHFEIQENTNGLFAQDSWRIRQNLTISYGVRWQPQSGARLNSANYAILTNPDMVFDVSGRNNLFSPGTVNPALRPTFRGNTIGEKAFQDDKNNFAPSVGVVYSPNFSSGLMNTILGGAGTSVFRGGFSRAYIREGTLIVENSLGQNPGGRFSVARSAATAGFTSGTNFRDPANPNLTPQAFNPTPVFPRAINTGSDAALGFASDFRSGYVDSYSVGYQRQLGRDTVVEFRYVGNRGKDMQLQYNLNEVNAIENGFGAEFANAQRNLLINLAAGRGATFAFSPAFAGTVPLPILVSYLQAGNPDPNLPTSYGTNFGPTSTVLGFLSPASPNVLGFAQTLANLTTFRNNGTAAGRPLNFLQNCPSSIGNCFLFTNDEFSSYDSGVIEVRRRMSDGLRFQASYVWGKSFTNAYAAAGTAFFGLGAGDQSNAANRTLRNPDLDKSESQIDVRHSFKMDATYDLPFGKGRSFFSNANRLTELLLGGFTVTPTLRWQSGAPILLENVQLVGMTRKELQKAVNVYYNTAYNQPSGAAAPIANVTYLPADIITNTIRAFTTTATTASGYAATNIAPTGQFIAPAGFGNCQQRAPGQCGFRKLVLYGPSFFKIDASVGKRFNVTEKRNVELRATFFDVLNRTNWRLGGWTGNVNNITGFTGTFGQMLNGWAYQDPNGSNDPGGRIMDLLVRINF